MEQKIPYKIYLNEDEIPKKWYNVRADMKNKPAPLINPGTGQPLTLEDLNPIFCEDLNKQELDNDTPYFDIPEEIQGFYKMYRPSPLVRAYFLEKALGTPAKIYYKFEGNNTSGSHKLNSSIAQAYYAKKQGLKGVTTETGAGQWGTALSMACSYFDLDCQVYMVKCSYEQKPFRREVMRTYGATVTPSPSQTTEVGRKILAEHPDTTGSLGCAISEAVEAAVTQPGYRYVLGSVLNQVLLHQSVIGLEAKAALDKYGVENFTRTVVDWADTKQDLDLKEKFWIAFGRQHYDCYNISDGGDGGPTRRGQHHTDETKRKISESHKGKVMSDEARRNMSLNHADFKGEKSPCWGKHPSDEARRKMSETHKLVDAGKNQRGEPPQAIKVMCIETQQIFDCIQDAKEWANCKHVGDCCKGKQHTAGGYHWKYVDEEESKLC